MFQELLIGQWEQLQARLASAGALLVEGELTGEGLHVAVVAESDVLVTLIERGLAQIAYTATTAWNPASTEALRHLVGRRREQAAELEELEDLFDAAAEQRDNVIRASDALDAVLEHAPSDSSLVQGSATVVVAGVQHEQLIRSDWYTQFGEAVTAFDAAVADFDDPPELDPERRDQRWEQLQAERAAQAAARETELARVGEALFEACVADPTFRTTRAETDRWQQALGLVRALVDWPELTQQDRGYLRPVARRAYEHVATVLVPAARDQARLQLDSHLLALQGRPGWASASTKSDRRREARRYLASVDVFLDDAGLADELVSTAT